MAYSVRLPQFWWKAKTPAISCDQGSISKYLFLGFGASWVPPHSASIVSSGEKNLGGWWAFQRDSKNLNSSVQIIENCSKTLKIFKFSRSFRSFLPIKSDESLASKNRGVSTPGSHVSIIDWDGEVGSLAILSLCSTWQHGGWENGSLSTACRLRHVEI